MGKNGFKVVQITGGFLLVVGGISAFSKFVIEGNYIGVLVSGIAFFLGVWLLGQSLELN